MALMVCMMLAGCAKSDGDNLEDEWPAFTINKDEIEIYAHETEKITPSEAFTARSEDEKVATVDAGGTVHGLSEGETDIVFKANASGKESRCRAKVSWRYHYYEEPLLDFGATPDEIKAKETHELISEESNTRFIYMTYNYSLQPIPMLVTYKFGVGFGWTEMERITFTWDEATDPFDEIKEQLDERYGDTEEKKPNYTRPYRTYYISEYYTFIVHTPWEFVYMLLY